MNIAICSIHVEDNSLAFPLAAALIKSSIEKRDFFNDSSIELFDFFLDDSFLKISEELLTKKFDVISFSVYCWNCELVLKVASILKEKSPNTLLFAGGAQATADPKSLTNSNIFDFVICGEGEDSVPKALEYYFKNKNFQDANISGLILNDRSNIERAVVSDIDTIDSVFLNKSIDLNSYKGALWEISRGCPYNCSFCFESRGTNKIRRFDMNRVENELKVISSCSFQEVWVLDPTFNHNKESAKEILKLIEQYAPDIYFTFEVRAENQDEELVDMFSKITCALQIGLQTSNPKIAKRLHRHFDKEVFQEKVELMRSRRLVFGLDLIYGLPDDNLKGFIDSLNYALSLAPDNLDIFPLAVLPGTQLALDAELFSLSYDHKPPYLLKSHPSFSEKDMVRASEIAELCNIFYTRGLSSSWFNIALDTLNMTGVELLLSFEEYIKNCSNFSLEDIEDHQRFFLEDLFRIKDKEELFWPLESYMLWNQALSYVLDGDPEAVVEINWTPDQLSELHHISLQEFVSFFPAEVVQWKIFRDDEGIDYTPI